MSCLFRIRWDCHLSHENERFVEDQPARSDAQTGISTTSRTLFWQVASAFVSRRGAWRDPVASQLGYSYIYRIWWIIMVWQLIWFLTSYYLDYLGPVLHMQVRISTGEGFVWCIPRSYGFTKRQKITPIWMVSYFLSFFWPSNVRAGMSIKDGHLFSALESHVRTHSLLSLGSQLCWVKNSIYPLVI